MGTDQDDFYISPERLAELQTISDGAPYPIPKDAKEAPPEFVEALRKAVVAHIVSLPTAEQAEILNSWPQANRDELLAELPEEQRERLLTLTVP
ncbi:MAG: hypothetical protein OXT07_16470 [bacterium]|nr:hypothetical protein [bacterium]MDE0215659.1 hypothetical protein [bacterium]